MEYQYGLILLFRQRVACSSDLISIHFLEIFQTAGSSDVSIDTFEEQTRLNIDHLQWFSNMIRLRFSRKFFLNH